MVKLSITNDLKQDVIKNYIMDMDKLISHLKKITEGKIIIIGYYENKYFDKSNVIILNSEISNIALKYGAIFININDLMVNKAYFPHNNAYYFNYKGHEEIAKMIIHSL